MPDVPAWNSAFWRLPELEDCLQSAQNKHERHKMLSIREQTAKLRQKAPRHHYILLLEAECPELAKQVELFADDVQEALRVSCASRAYHSAEIWEDGKFHAVLRLQ